nr:hypothetical protein CFP56_03029 [Quercus suber]
MARPSSSVAVLECQRLERIPHEVQGNVVAGADDEGPPARLAFFSHFIISSSPTARYRAYLDVRPLRQGRADWCGPCLVKQTGGDVLDTHVAGERDRDREYKCFICPCEAR